MRKKSFFVAIMVLTILSIAVSCVKDLDEIGFSSTTDYTGIVVEESSLQPIEGVLIQITDGNHIHASTKTDGQGKFIMRNINFKEIDENCYLLLDGSTIGLSSVEEELRGLGHKTYDYKTLKVPGNYDALPTFQYNGHIYRVAPSTSEGLLWSDANIHCETLTLYGYSDWRMPTSEELTEMYINKYSIGGFNSIPSYQGPEWSDAMYWSATQDYVSSTDWGRPCYSAIGFTQGIFCSMPGDEYLCYVRPIRMEY